MSHDEDKILQELNAKLEKERKEKEGESDEPEEVEEEVEEEIEEKPPKKKAKPARFKGRDGKPKEVRKRKKSYQCPNKKCGGTSSKRLDDGNTIMSARGILVSEVHRCLDCGRRFGVVK